MAQSFYTDIKLNGNKVITLGNGTAPDDAVNLGQLNTAISGIDLSGYATDAELLQEAGDRNAADNTLNARLDAINIIGDGMVTSVEEGDNTWRLTVDSLQLSNTYTGTAGPETDVTAPEPGDIYINTGTGAASIYTGTEWVELSSADVGINAITSTGGTINVSVPAGPSTNLEVSTGLLAQIGDSTVTNTAQDARLDALEAASGSADTDISAIEAEQIVQNDRMTAIEAVNTTQDGRLGALETSQAAQDTAIQANTDTNVTQDGKISALETSQAAQDTAIAANTTKNTEQDARLDAVETVNTTQDTRLSGLEANAHPAVTSAANQAVWIDGSQVVQLLLDPTGSPALTQTTTGLKLDTAALSGVTKKFSQTVDLSVTPSATVTHNLNTVAVTVQTSTGTGVVGLDVVRTDMNTVTVSAKAASSDLTAVTVVVVG